MANNRRIDFTFGAKVDQGSFNSVKKSFDELAAKANTNKLTSNVNEGLQQAAKSAQQLQAIFNQSWDSGLNQLDLKKFNQGLANSRTSFQSLQKEFQNAGAVGQKHFEELTRSVMYSNEALKTTKTRLDKMAETFSKTVTWGISSRIFNELIGSVQHAYSYVKQLDESLNDIRIVTGKSADEMDRFAKSANNAAKNLASSTTDYTKASLIYYQQGLGDKEVKQRTDTTIKTANVTGQSTQQVSEELTAVWNGYKVATEDTEKYIDKMAAVAAHSASNLEELSTAIAKVASTAESGGVSMDQLTAQISTIESVTRQAPESIGTALRTVYNRMSSLKLGETTEDGVSLGNYTQQLAQIGVSALDSNGELRNLGTMMEEVAGKWDTLSTAQQKATAQAMGGTRQSNYIEALMNNWGQYQNMLETAKNSEGTLAEQQAIYMDSMAAHAQKLSTEIERTYDVMFDSDSYKTTLDAITAIVERFNDFIEGIGGAGNAFLALGAIVTNVFSKQIGMSMNQSIKNLKQGFGNMMFDAANGRSNFIMNSIVQGHNRRQEESNAAEARMNRTEADLDKGKWGQQSFDASRSVAFMNLQNGTNINENSKTFEKQVGFYQEAYKYQRFITEEQKAQFIEANKMIGVYGSQIEALEKENSEYNEALSELSKMTDKEKEMYAAFDISEGEVVDYKEAIEQLNKSLSNTEKSIANIKKGNKNLSKDARYALGLGSAGANVRFNEKNTDSKGKNTDLFKAQHNLFNLSNKANDDGDYGKAEKYLKLREKILSLYQKSNNLTRAEKANAQELLAEYNNIVQNLQKENGVTLENKNLQDEINKKLSNENLSEKKRAEILKQCEEIRKRELEIIEMTAKVDKGQAAQEELEALRNKQQVAEDESKGILNDGKANQKADKMTKAISAIGFAASAAAGSIGQMFDESTTGAEKGNAALQGITAGINAVGMAFGPMGMAITGIVTSVVSSMPEVKKWFQDAFMTAEEKVTAAREEIEKLNQEMRDFGSKMAQSSNTINSLKDNEGRINTLMKKVNEQGTGALTSEELSEWNGYAQSLVENNQNLLVQYDEEGNAIIRNNNAVKETIELMKEKNKQSEAEFYTQEKIKETRKASDELLKREYEQKNKSLADSSSLLSFEKNNSNAFLYNRNGYDSTTTTGKLFGGFLDAAGQSHKDEISGQREKEWWEKYSIIGDIEDLMDGKSNPIKIGASLTLPGQFSKIRDNIFKDFSSGELEDEIHNILDEYENLPLDELADKKEEIVGKFEALAEKTDMESEAGKKLQTALDGLKNTDLNKVVADNRKQIANSFSTASIVNVAENDDNINLKNSDEDDISQLDASGASSKEDLQKFNELGLQNGDALKTAYIDGMKNSAEAKDMDFATLQQGLGDAASAYFEAYTSNGEAARVMDQYANETVLQGNESITEYIERVSAAAETMYTKLIAAGVKHEDAVRIVAMTFGIVINKDGKSDKGTLDALVESKGSQSRNLMDKFKNDFDWAGADEKQKEKAANNFMKALQKAGYSAETLQGMNDKDIDKLYKRLNINNLYGKFKDKMTSDLDDSGISDIGAEMVDALTTSAQEELARKGGLEKVLKGKDFDTIRKEMSKLADAGQLTDEYINEDHLGEKNWKTLTDLAEKYGLTIKEVTDKLKDMQSASDTKKLVNQISSFGDQVNSIRNILKQKAEVGTNGVVDAKYMKDIPEEWSKAAPKEAENFIKTAMSSGKTMKEVTNAANDFASAVLTSSSYMRTFSEADEDMLSAQLKSIGILNHEALAHELVTQKKKQRIAAEKELGKSKKDIMKMSDKEFDDLVTEKDLSDEARQGIIDLTLAREKLNLENLDFSKDIDAMVNLAEAAGQTAEFIAELQDVLNQINSGKSEGKNAIGEATFGVSFARKKGESFKDYVKRYNDKAGTNLSISQASDMVRGNADGLLKIVDNAENSKKNVKQLLEDITTKGTAKLKQKVEINPKDDKDSKKKSKGTQAGKASEINTKNIDEKYYESINAMIKTQGDLLGLIDQRRKNLIGADYIKSLDLENTTLEKQNKLLLENIKMAKDRIKEFQKGKNATKEIKKVTEETYTDANGNTKKVNALKYVGGKKIKYDENGAILNGNEIQKAANEKLKREKEEYNSDVKKFNKNKSKSKKEKDAKAKERLDDRKAQLEAQQKSIDDFSTYLKQREEDYQEYLDALKQYEANLMKEIENEIAKHEVAIKLVADFTEFQVSLDEYQRQSADLKVKLGWETEPDAVKDKSSANVKDAYAYANQAAKDMEQLEHYQKKVKKMNANEKSEFSKWNKETKSWVKNESAAMEKLKEYQKKVQDDVINAMKVTNQLQEDYNANLDKAIDTLSKMKTLNSDIIGILASQAEYELIINGSNTKEGQNAKLNSLKKQKEYLEEIDKEIDKQITLESERQITDKSTDTAIAHEMKIADLEKQKSENLKNLNKNAIDTRDTLIEITRIDLEHSIFGRSLDSIKTKWELIKKVQEGYYDEVQRTNNISKIGLAYDELIEQNKDNLHLAEMINEQKDREVKYMNNIKKLSEGEIKRQEALLNVLKAKIALEEAQKNKNAMRLRRDSQGNYTYQYTANNNDIASAKSNLKNAENELWNVNRNNFVTEGQKMIDTVSNFSDSLKKIYEQYGTGDESKQAVQDLISATKARTENNAKDLKMYFEEFFKDSNISGFLENLNTVQGYENITKTDLLNMSSQERLNALKMVLPEMEALTDKQEAFLTGKIGLQDYMQDQEKAFDKANEDISKHWSDTNGFLKSNNKKLEDISGALDKIVKLFDGNWQSYYANAEENKKQYNGMLAYLGNPESGFQQVITKVSGTGEVTLDTIQAAINNVANKEKNNSNGVTINTVTPSKDNTNNNTNPTSKSTGNNSSNKTNDDNPSVTPEPKKETKSEITSFQNYADAATMSSATDFYAGSTAPQQAKYDALEAGMKELSKKTAAYGGNSTYMYKPTKKPSSAVNKYLLKSGLFDTKWTKDKILTTEGAKFLIDYVYKRIQGSTGKGYLYFNDPKHNMWNDLADFFKGAGISLDTGGYTGSWGKEGRIAMLHEKELVLNKEDTENMLKAIEILRESKDSLWEEETKSLKENALNKITNGIKDIMHSIKSKFEGTQKQTLEQTVHIDATFPNVKDASEVEEALKNLTSKASQYNVK